MVRSSTIGAFVVSAIMLAGCTAVGAVAQFKHEQDQIHAYMGLVTLSEKGEIERAITSGITSTLQECKVKVLALVAEHAEDIANLVTQGVTVKGECLPFSKPVVEFPAQAPKQDSNDGLESQTNPNLQHTT